ncbi:MAG: PAS domain-containing protein [Thermotogota bacterium]|nr:PAS domain-containing protein [Thermotogota bacterium]
MNLTKEELIKTHGKHFFQTLNLIPSAIGILDLSGTIIYINKAFEKESSVKTEAVIGKTIFDFYLRHDHKARMTEYFQKMVDGKAQPGLYIDKVDSVKNSKYQEINWDRIKIDGKLAGFIYTSVNNSTRALLQNQVEEKEKTLDLQKEIVERLRKKMQLALEAANEGVWEWDLTTDEVQYDDRYFEMLGFKREDLADVENIWAYLIHPDDVELYNEGFSKFLNEKTSKYEFKYRLKNAWGGWTWILDKGQGIEKDENGKPCRLIGVHVDITATMTKKQEIEKLKNDLETAMAVSDVGNWSFEIEKDIAILKKVLNRIHEVDREEITEHFQDCIKGKTNELNVEVRMHFKKYNEYRWVLIKGVVTEKYPDGKAKTIMGTYKDINEIKEKEEALIKAKSNLEIQKGHMEELNMNLIESNFELNYTKKLLEIVLRNARVGISRYDIKKQKSNYDEVCETIFGYNPSYGTDDPWIDHILEEDKEQLFDTIFDYQGNVIPEYDVQYRFKRPDGKIIWIQEKGEIVEYDENGPPTILLGSVRDITPQKDFEQLLIKAKEDAQRASKLKTDLVSNINHELRTPLTIIMGMAETVMISEEDDEKKKFLNQIVESSKRLLELINDILDLSKIESGSITLSPTETTLRPFLRNYFFGIDDQAKKKGVKTIFIVDKSVPIKFTIDKNKLVQIMNNIFGNSLKCTEKGYIGLRLTRNNEQIVFYLFDTGIGIPKKYKDKVFQRFYQIDGSSRRKFGGTGLGLSIVKELADLMKAHIEVISEKGKGTTFKIAFSIEK